MALKFRKDTLTPAMQAGLVSKRLTFLEIFMAIAAIFLCLFILLVGRPCQDDDASLMLAA